MKIISIEGFDKLVSQLILGNLVDEVNLIAPDTLLSELNMGAIEKVSLAVDLEEQCAVDIPDADIDDFRSVGDVIQYLEQHVAQNEEKPLAEKRPLTEEKPLVAKQKNYLSKQLKQRRFSEKADKKDNLFLERGRRTGDFPVVATFKLS